MYVFYSTRHGGVPFGHFTWLGRSFIIAFFFGNPCAQVQEVMDEMTNRDWSEAMIVICVLGEWLGCVCYVDEGISRTFGETLVVWLGMYGDGGREYLERSQQQRNVCVW